MKEGLIANYGNNEFSLKRANHPKGWDRKAAGLTPCAKGTAAGLPGECSVSERVRFRLVETNPGGAA